MADETDAHLEPRDDSDDPVAPSAAGPAEVDPDGAPSEEAPDEVSDAVEHQPADDASAPDGVEEPQEHAAAEKAEPADTPDPAQAESPAPEETGPKTAVDLGLLPDDETRITAAFEEGAATCDALVSSGGVSMGEFDFVKAVLDRVGEINWMQVAIKPAKPLAFGTVDGKPVFGLPGNPVSSMVSFELFARPALRQMMGHTELERPAVDAVCDEALDRRPDGKVHFARVVAGYGDDGRVHVRSAGGQASHLLRAMALANALAVVPDGDGVPAGGTVRTMLLS